MKKLYLWTAIIGYSIAITLCFFDLPIEMLWVYAIYPVLFFAVGESFKDAPVYTAEVVGFTLAPALAMLFIPELFPDSFDSIDILLKGAVFALTTSALILEWYIHKYFG